MALTEYCVQAIISNEEAADFEERFEDAPEAIAPGFVLMKAPSEDDIQFIVEATDEADALAQFAQAVAFTGCSATDISASVC